MRACEKQRSSANDRTCSCVMDALATLRKVQERETDKTEDEDKRREKFYNTPDKRLIQKQFLILSLKMLSSSLEERYILPHEQGV